MFCVCRYYPIENKNRVPGLLLLFGVIQCDVAPFARADADGIFYRDDKNAAIANLARACRALDCSYGLLYVLVAHHDIYQHALDAARIVHHATVNPCLAHLAFAPHVVVGKPLDVGGKQCLLDILKPRLTDDSLNLLHNYYIDGLYFLFLSFCCSRLQNYDIL